MGRTSKRPPPVRVEPFRARVVRGPGEAPGTWYWRVERFVEGADVTLFCCWATRDDIIKRIHKLDVDERAKAAPTECRTVQDLLELWVGDLEERREAGHVAPRSLASYRNRANRLAELLGRTLVTQFGSTDLATYQRHRAKNGNAPWTVEADVIAFRPAGRLRLRAAR